jgi:hypothetical protein
MKLFSVRRIWGILLAVCTLLAVSRGIGCGPYDSGSDDITVLVSVEGLTPDIVSLNVATTLNGTPSKQAIPELTTRLDQFAIYLPRNTAGTLGVKIVGHSVENCVVAKGEGQIEVKPAPPTFVKMNVTISTGAVGAGKQCSLKVEVRGKGKVTSAPAGIDCSNTDFKSAPVTCSADFAVGTSITLTADAGGDAKVLGAVFAGPCSGTNTCTMNFAGPGTVKSGFAPRVCSADNWCWHNPLPQGLTLRAIWGPAADDIWAVGDYGTIMHYDGLTWQLALRAGTLTTQDFYAVYGVSATDIWAVGTSGTLAHYDGKNWSLSPDSGAKTSNLLRGVWGSGPQDFWAVGNSGTILRYDRNGWANASIMTPVPTNTYYSIWGAAADDVWVVGSGGILMRWNGTIWAPGPGSASVTTATLYAVRGTARDNVWATGSGSTRIRYNGSAWAVDASMGYTATTAQALWVGQSSVWAVGSGAMGSVSNRFDGSAWTAANTNFFSVLYGALGFSDNDVWAVGLLGALYHYDGQNWTPAPLSSPASNVYFNAIWGSGPSDIWIGGYNNALSYPNYGYMRRYNGTTWSVAQFTPMPGINAIHGTQPANVHAAGENGLIARFDGTNWTQLSNTTTASTRYLYAVYTSTNPTGTMPTAWAVGDSGALLAVNNTVVSLHGQSGMITTQPLTGVWGLSASTVFASGGGGTVLRYNYFAAAASQWTAQTVSGTLGTTYLGNLHGSTIFPARIWGVGSNGAIVYYDGSTGLWTTHTQSGTNTGTGLTTNFLYKAYTINSTAAWIVSDSNIYRYDGTNWVTQSVPLRFGLRAVWANNASDAWAVGSNDLVLRYQP